VNRRTYLKNILYLGAVGTAYASIWKFVKADPIVDPHAFIQQRDLLAELVEIIIPTTDTPGAKAAGVHDYIIKVMMNCREPRAQSKFINGLEDLNAYSLDNYGKTFLKCTINEKTAILNHSEAHSEYKNRLINKISNKLLGRPFFTTLKDLTVQGYCTSELGATQGLAYDYIPGAYRACIPILKHQKSWATK
jgi:hypothetical protein